MPAQGRRRKQQRQPRRVVVELLCRHPQGGFQARVVAVAAQEIDCERLDRGCWVARVCGGESGVRARILLPMNGAGASDAVHLELRDTKPIVACALAPSNHR